VRIAKNEAKMTDEDIAAVAEGPDSKHWNDIEAALVRAADELHTDAMVSDATWAKLSEHYSRNQMMDIVAAVGGYTLVSMMLNSFGVQLDDSLEPYEGFPQG
jgi:alkylhydroperoxidase family enzyme